MFMEKKHKPVCFECCKKKKEKRKKETKPPRAQHSNSGETPAACSAEKIKENKMKNQTTSMHMHTSRLPIARRLRADPSNAHELATRTGHATARRGKTRRPFDARDDRAALF